MELYYEDAYLKSFSSKVSSISYSNSHALIILEKTAFFPGGGGQSFDTGTIAGKNGSAKVVETRMEGSDLVHVCLLKGTIEVGEEVQCRIDWDRRYELMRAHTAQHMFFQCLSRFFKDLYVIKDNIDVGRHALFIRSPEPLDFTRLMEAEKLANQVIQEGKRVIVRWVKREEAGKGDFRVKLDRIKGNEVRVIDIEGFDKSACSGVHVLNTREIGLLAVTRLTREGNEYTLEFEFGEKARDFLLQTKKIAMNTCSILQTHPELLEKTAEKLRAENLLMQEQLKELNEELLSRLEPTIQGSVKIYSKIFSGMDSKKLMEKAGELIEQENVSVIFGNKGEKGFLLIAKNPKMSLNLKAVAGKAFGILEGKWGGKEYFVSGAGKAEKLGEAVEAVIDVI
ncbi:MAG: alanyl-tRNA synthetase [Candidatus Fermentimicrarchaeum limneticum]|uniref:Alanyl-tRNA synthetase n=1 Tax=Fermentimicrarchaeum limneticum TaxID=2795018 RepID=A0A7D5XMK0_FERL1|nr:MAG: alanyl-tRNA synthetase [Candidatus Fermentimicrarchaeum limneticum]